MKSEDLMYNMVTTTISIIRLKYSKQAELKFCLKKKKIGEVSVQVGSNVWFFFTLFLDDWWLHKLETSIMIPMIWKSETIIIRYLWYLEHLTMKLVYKVLLIGKFPKWITVMKQDWDIPV